MVNLLTLLGPIGDHTDLVVLGSCFHFHTRSLKKVRYEGLPKNIEYFSKLSSTQIQAMLTTKYCSKAHQK